MTPFSFTQWARVNFGILISKCLIIFHFLDVFFFFFFICFSRFLSFVYFFWIPKPKIMHIRLSHSCCKMIKEISVKELSTLGSKSPVNNSWLITLTDQIENQTKSFFYCNTEFGPCHKQFPCTAEHGPFF